MSFREIVIGAIILFILFMMIRFITRGCGQRFSLHVTLETPMAIGNIEAGSTGQLATTLELNGQPFTEPFNLSLTYSADDPQVTFAPATTDATNGAVPLEHQEVVSVPAGDQGTSVTITVSAVDPDGKQISTSITIPLTPQPRVFTLVTTQVA